jgi:ATP/ADP translocase
VPKGLPVGHSPRRPRHLLVMNPDPSQISWLFHWAILPSIVEVSMLRDRSIDHHDVI